MRIIFVSGLIMILLSNIYAMDPGEDKSENSQLIQEIEVLRPYYKAIQQIRITLENVASKFNRRTGFSAWPHPTHPYWRTPKYIFLETEADEEGERLYRLHTPFGEVKLLFGGIRYERDEISKEFLKNMRWELKDATNQISIYKEDENKLFGPYSLKDMDISKIYLVTSVALHNFYEENSQEKLIVFASISWTEKQQEKDIEQFKELSDGKGCF